MRVAAVGAGLYWAFMLMSVISDSALNRSVHDGLLSEVRLSSLAISLFLCLLALALRGFLRKPAAQKSVILCALAFWTVYMVSGLLSGSIPSLQGVSSLLQRFMVSVVPPFLMLLWSLVFACMSRRVVVRVVVCATLTAAVAYLASISISPWIDCSFLQEILIAASLILLFILNCKIPLYIEQRGPAENRRPLFSFYGGRVVVGLSLGFIQTMGAAASVGSMWSAATRVVLLAFPAAAVLFALVVQIKKESLGLPLFLMPMIASAALLLPVLTQGALPSYSLWGVAWVSWIILSSAQLSELKHTFGMGESSLSFTEKIAVIASWIVGSVMSKALMVGVVNVEGWPDAIMLACLFGVFGVLVWATMLLNGLIEQKKQSQAISDSIKNEEEQSDLLIAKLARDNGLTPREAEICALLVRGYTRSHISSTLVIADGTVKTHIEHIYKKTGCHTRSELIALFEGEKSRYCA